MRCCKSSAKVHLAVIGAIALSACDNGPRYTNRDIYASAADCQKDWGRPESCEAGNRATDSNRSSRVWYGPSYNTDFGVPRGKNAVGTSSVSRGGFGSSAAAHGGGS